MNNQPPEIPHFISEERIRQRVSELGAMISADFQGKNNLRIIGALKGCFVFMADLIRAVSIPMRVDFMEISSYGNAMESSGQVKIIKDLTHSIAGEHIIIAEDIIDTGLTLNKVMDLLSTREPASLSIAALLVKPHKMQLKYPVRYRGFDIADEFVVGYGLDYRGFMRNLPYIGNISNDNQLELFAGLEPEKETR